MVVDELRKARHSGDGVRKKEWGRHFIRKNASLSGNRRPTDRPMNMIEIKAEAIIFERLYFQENLMKTVNKL